MSRFITNTDTTTVIDENGDKTITKKEQNTALVRNNEPDYIKLYTKIWSEFNDIPVAYRDLFLQLAMRMTYCNSNDLKNAQLVNTGKPYSDSIKHALGWKEDMYKKGLRELTNLGAIKRIVRGVYQVNPEYVGKGEWKYNPKLNRGGVEDLIAIFKFKEKSVDTRIIWSDNGTNCQFNEMYRDGLNVDKEAETVLSQIVLKNQTKNDMESYPDNDLN
jgi:hypothetical protein